MKPTPIFVTLALIVMACSQKETVDNTDNKFAAFETRFLDAYWNQYPANSIYVGYGKYYDKLVIPDSTAYAGNVKFSNQWIDSLNALSYNKLSDNNKISFNIIKNQLESDIW